MGNTDFKEKSNYKLHIIAHANLEPSNQFNFEKMKLSPITNFFLSQSRVFLCNPSTYQIYTNTTYQENKFTKTLQILKIDLNSPNPTIEGKSFGMQHSDGIWCLVDEENSKTPPIPIENNEIFKLGQQVLRFQIYNVNQKDSLNANFLTLYKHIFDDYDFSSQTSFDFTYHFSLEEKKTKYNDQLIKNSNVSERPDQLTCRVCLESESSKNPFARQICKCSESMPIHGECLLDWIKLKCKPNKCKSYFYYDLANIYCDVCKDQYPPFLDINGERKPLLKIPFQQYKLFALAEIYKINSSTMKHIVILDMSKRTEQKYSVGNSDKCDIQFKHETISQIHSIIKFKGDRIFISNIDKKYGTLRRIDSKMKMENLHMKVLITGKFSFLFHVMKSGNCSCIKKGIKTLKADPLDFDPRIVEKDFDSIKKELKSFAIKAAIQRTERTTVNEISINSSNPQIRAKTQVELPDSSDRPKSIQRNNVHLVSDNFLTESKKKVRDDTSNFQIIKYGKKENSERTLETQNDEPRGRSHTKLPDLVQAKKPRIEPHARIENDFSVDLIDGEPLPKLSIGGSDLYFNSDMNFKFD